MMYRTKMRKRNGRPKWGVVALTAGALALGALAYRGCAPAHKKPAIVTRAEGRVAYPKLHDNRSQKQLEEAVVESKYPVVFGNPELPAVMQRIDRYERSIEKWSKIKSIPKYYLEGVIGLESGGNAYSFNGGGLVGLGQLSVSACEDADGKNVVKKTISLAESRRLRGRYGVLEQKIHKLERLAQRGKINHRQLKELRKLRSTFSAVKQKLPSVDRRFNPYTNIADTARYIKKNKDRFDGGSFAIAAHHMGPTHMAHVINYFVSGSAFTKGRTPKETVEIYGLNYPRIYLNSSPTKNPKTYAYLVSLDDNSKNYMFKVMAFRDARRLWKNDRKRFYRNFNHYPKRPNPNDRMKMQGNALLQGAERYENLGEMAQAVNEGELVYVPDEPRRLGIDVDWSPSRGVGALARHSDGKRGHEFLGKNRKYYGTLSPAACGALTYLAEEVRKQSGNNGFVFHVTSLTRNDVYKKALMRTNPNASPQSTHDTGYAFDVKREYPLPRVASAVQYALESGRDRGYWSFRKEDATLCVHVDVNPAFNGMFTKFYEGVAKQLR